MIFGFWGVLFLCYCNSEDNLTASQDGVLQWLNLGCFMILETEWCLILFLKLGLTLCCYEIEWIQFEDCMVIHFCLGNFSS